MNAPTQPPTTPTLKSYRLSADAEGGLAGTAADQPRVDQPLLEQPMVAGAFLRNAWYMAGWAADFTAGRLVHRTMLGEPLVIYRLGDGKLAALEDRMVKPEELDPQAMAVTLSFMDLEKLVLVVGILVAVADIQWQAVVVAQVMFRC